MNYQTLSERSLIEALFIDPSLVRKIVERDQTIIYTDGNRSVQFRPGQETMTFTDPALPDQQTEPSLEEKLRNSVSFVNQYIGWTDPFYLESIEQRAGEGEVFTFRHYLGPYPMVTDQAQGLEKLSITSYNGQVISLRRSLYNLGTVIKSREMQILSGPELLELLRSWELDANKLRNAYLAYRLVLHESYAECIPVWVLEWTDGKQELVDASVPEEGGVYGGLE
jgi:regulatory protein YycH of two-component signal transduction system YycFG